MGSSPERNRSGGSGSRRRVLRGFTPSDLDKEEMDEFTGRIWGKRDAMESISEKVLRTPDGRRMEREDRFGGGGFYD